MKRLSCPSRADGDGTSPDKRDQDGSKDNWVRPVGMLGWLEGGCWVGGAGDPLVVETDGNEEDDYGCEVESENEAAEAERNVAAAGRYVEV